MQNTSMVVTVAICTYNRARSLDRTLSQMTRLQVPNNCQWELLVINNNSIDDTEAVVAKYGDALPIRCMFEANQGLSYARNRAIAEAKGEFIVWTDDDVLVSENWLLEYLEGFKRHSNAVFFGGPIQPLFEGPKPRWLNANFRVFGGAFGHINLGDEEIELSSRSTFPFGANMAVHKDVYEEILYNVEIGRIGAGMLSCEETVFFEELIKCGKKGIWLPRAKLEHCIPISNMTVRHVKRFFRGYGQTLIRTNDKNEVLDPSVFGIPRWMIRYWFKIYIKWIFSVFFMRHKSAGNWINLQVHIGKMIEYRN